MQKGEDIDNYRLRQIKMIEDMKDPAVQGVQYELMARLLRSFKCPDEHLLQDYVNQGGAAVLGQIAKCPRWSPRPSPEVFDAHKYNGRMEEIHVRHAVRGAAYLDSLRGLFDTFCVAAKQ